MTKMDSTIGLNDLLEEVNRDLDEIRKKNPADYSLRSTSLWWQLERERLLLRHTPNTVVKKIRKARSANMLVWFIAGWLTTLIAQAAIQLIEL